MMDRWMPGGKTKGKIYAALSLVQFVRYFANWREVWAAYRSGAAIPPLEFRAGLKIFHGEGDDAILLFREMFVDRPYTRQRFYTPKTGDTIVDLGANIGGFTLYLLWQTRRIKVHCFEPSETTFALLRRNVEVNQLEDVVSIYPIAVSDRSGTTHLSLRGRSIDRALVHGSRTEEDEFEEVRTMSLDEAIALCTAGEIDLLKMDIEGAELEAVTAASAALWSRVKRVAMEYHESLRPGCLVRLCGALRDAGFVDIQVEPANADQGILRAGK
jgi:FkbM family methyltransferase